MITLFIVGILSSKILSDVTADTVLLAVVIGVASDLNFISNMMKG